MKRFVLLTALAICSFQWCVAGPSQDTLAKNEKPYYIQLYAGINKSANENLPWTELTRYPWAGGAFFSVGKESGPLLGWRLTLRYNHNKSRNVPACENKDVWRWKNVGLFGDITFNITDILQPLSRNSGDAFDLKAFAGVGLARTWDFDQVPLSYTHPYSRTSRVVPAVRAGATASWKLTDRWRFGAELSHTLFEDHFNGVAAEFPLDSRTNLKVGLTYLFIAKEKLAPKVVERRKKLKECPELPLIMPEAEAVKERRVSGRAFLDFPVNETVIYPSYRNNQSELQRIQATVDSAMFDESITITRISLHGYASPESPYSNNTRLASGRTEALMNYLIQKYGLSLRIFNNTYTPEDWDNLRGFLENMQGRRVKGDYWYDNKDYIETPEPPAYVIQHRTELLEVINRIMDPDAKEVLLRQVGNGEPYAWLLKHVYPGLRHTDYIIEYKVEPYSVEKGRRLIYTHPEALSLKEMCLVAMSYDEGEDGWVDAMLIAARRYPFDKTANLNAACACVKIGRLADAKMYLKRAGYGFEATYLRNVIQAMEGTVDWRMEDGRVMIIEDEDE